jgi:hypothetical protein
LEHDSNIEERNTSIKISFPLAVALFLTLSAVSCPQGSGTTDNVVTHNVVVSYPVTNCPASETQFIQFAATNPITMNMTKSTSRPVDTFTARMCFICEKPTAPDVIPNGVSRITATLNIPGFTTVSLDLPATDATGCTTGRTTVRNNPSPEKLCNDILNFELDQGAAGLDAETMQQINCVGY